ncbi:MAG: hypothetical protein WAU01_07195, partial [Saprospiraceae bacterium]
DSISPQRDKLMLRNILTIDYELIGNRLNEGMYINNSFREIYICNEFILATKKLTDTTSVQKYFRSSCNGALPIFSLEKFVSNNINVKYDTASVEYVNYIFSSYK